MDLKYKRQHNESYMIINSNDACNSAYEEKMIENNTIEALLKMTSLVANGEKQYLYNISKLESLRDYLENEIPSIELIQRILLFIHIGLEELERYLINQNHILLNPDTIFVERGVNGFKVKFCYFSGIDESPQTQLRTVIQWIMTSASRENSSIAHQLCEMYSLALKEDFTIMELVEFLNEGLSRDCEVELVQEINDVEKKELVEAPKEIRVEEVNLYEEDYFEYSSEEKSMWELLVDKFDGFFSNKFSKAKMTDRFTEDFVVEPDMDICEPTVCIRPEDMKCNGKLIYDGDFNEQNFVIEKDVFKIGTADNNDAIIASKTVSRHHARIIQRQDDYYIEDLNSTNGTMVNAKSLEYKNPVKLKALDRIRLGDVEYVFM